MRIHSLPLAFVSLAVFSASTAFAKAPTASHNFYVCKMCKTYYSQAMAKKMGYKDPMGHKLVHMSKVPAGFKMATGSMMGGSMMGGKMSGHMGHM